MHLPICCYCESSRSQIRQLSESSFHRYIAVPDSRGEGCILCQARCWTCLGREVSWRNARRAPAAEIARCAQASIQESPTQGQPIKQRSHVVPGEVALPGYPPSLSHTISPPIQESRTGYGSTAQACTHAQLAVRECRGTLHWHISGVVSLGRHSEEISDDCHSGNTLVTNFGLSELGMAMHAQFWARASGGT